jgi:hypothetical protein
MADGRHRMGFGYVPARHEIIKARNPNLRAESFPDPVWRAHIPRWKDVVAV